MKKRINGGSQNIDYENKSPLIKYTFNDGAITAVKYEVPFDFFLCN